MKPFVYFLKFQSGCFYVGSTSDIDKRIDRHKRELRLNNHHNVNVQRQYDLYRTFDVTKIECDSLDIARTLEQAILDRCFNTRVSNLVLNIGKAAIGGDNLSANPNRDSVISNITAAVRERYSQLDAGQRAVIYGSPGKQNGMFGKTHTDEVKRKMSSLRKGKKPANAGKPMPEHQRLAMIERQKLRTGNKNSFFGKKHSETTILRLREKMIGKMPINSSKVEFDGVVYASIASLARSLGVSSAIIHYRLRNKEKYPNYSKV